MKHLLERFWLKLITNFIPNNQLLILNYHRILEDSENQFSVFDRLDHNTFENQIKVLTKYYKILDVESALNLLAQGKLPKNCLCLTFDDGYKECYYRVFLILKNLNITATFFITSAGVEFGHTWETIIESTVQQISQDITSFQFDNVVYDLSTIDTIAFCVREVTNAVKYKTLEERDKSLKYLRELSGLNNFPREYMTIDQLSEMSEAGMNFGAHTVNHPILALENELIVKSELNESKKFLEAITNKPVNLFAYPNGKFEKDFNFETLKLVQSSGFKFAFSTEWGSLNVNSIEGINRFKLKRINPCSKKGRNMLLYIANVNFKENLKNWAFK